MKPLLTRTSAVLGASPLIPPNEAKTLATGADDEDVSVRELAEIIEEATEYVASIVGYPLTRKKKSEFYRYWPSRCFTLSPQGSLKTPASPTAFSSMSVSYLDAQGSRKTLPEDDWALDTTADPPLVWLVVPQSADFSQTAKHPIEIAYEYDPPEVPKALKAATAEVFRYRFESRRAGAMFDANAAYRLAQRYVAGHRRTTAAL